MENAKKTFISSTFWTERLGYSAALSTLKYMEKHKIQNEINKSGILIKKAWRIFAKKYGLKIKVTGLNALPSFIFLNDYNTETITFFTQEMLKNNILASNVIYLSHAHKQKHIANYLKNCGKIFKQISLLKDKKSLIKKLNGKTRQSHLKRMN